MFEKVLIANRGAIAVRIIRTLKKMGVRSLAVYTRADQDSLHVDLADEAVLIGDGPARDSYLNESLILQTAKEYGADAIHPGYGFLSENAGFSRACAQNGIVFIGPTPEQMELFGLKHKARELAQKAKVPLLPGSGLIADLDAALASAESIGYPVMLKSTAGGGGIGMKICETPQQLTDSFEQVHHLAESNFNDGGVFVEKYIAHARHIEVQIFGNADGEVVALGERDCSVQRRNQKVMEETPAPGISDKVRAAMMQAAVRLAQSVGYRSAGTVEFLYDTASQAFYFLEVNTRLQVEHGVTEQVTGLDLVEWMIREAAEELHQLRAPVAHGCSIQARIYAEDSLLNFRPSAGRVDSVSFPEDVRVETWVQDHTTVSPLYDPLLAKLIVTADTREQAVEKMERALAQTKIYGPTTNLRYLHQLLQQPVYREGRLSTGILNGFFPAEHTLEVVDGGVQTTVQDYPGFSGYWDVGVPPCGPMDSYSFRLGNQILGNPEDASGLEMTLRGGSYKFRGDNITFCLTGADMAATLDGKPVPRFCPVSAQAGQTLTLGEAKQGMRAYLLIGGGFDIPRTLGSRSTFTLGQFGGHQGRALRTGDVLQILPEYQSREISLPESCAPAFTNEWEIGVVPGPHCTTEFLAEDYLPTLESAGWEVHFNSNRTGVRLVGPAPHWTREDGGEAGLHPSNIHDNAYAVGSVDMTGDMPILLGPDGPSLGGFVCSATVPSAELWKLGQLHPGDTVHFRLLTLEQAQQLRRIQEENLACVQDGALQRLQTPALPAPGTLLPPDYPVMVRQSDNRDFPICVRCAGDEYLLVEYGDMEIDLLIRFQIHALMEALKTSSLPILDLTPGVRSLQVHIDSQKQTLQRVCEELMRIESELPALHTMTVPSRTVWLPLSWNDPAIQLAVDRYQENVRPDAPWCPSNIEFIRRINGLDSVQQVQDIIFNATYLVLGLGDVYLGAPLTVSLDPRHRLVTTKYNPARTWTPENAVGIGGAYMCVYGMEGPGGYQLFGRTIQMWNSLRPTQTFKKGKPWSLQFFDQIKFYPVSPEELLTMREDFLRGRFEMKIEQTSFNLGDYLHYLDSIADSARAFKQKQQAAFEAEHNRWKQLGLDTFISEHDAVGQPEEKIPEGMTAVRSSMPGSVWKIPVAPGDSIAPGDPVVVEESMKMELTETSPVGGTVEKICVEQGAEVTAGQVLAIIRLEGSVCSQH